jgi:hypothetical protein
VREEIQMLKQSLQSAHQNLRQDPLFWSVAGALGLVVSVAPWVLDQQWYLYFLVAQFAAVGVGLAVLAIVAVVERRRRLHHRLLWEAVIAETDRLQDCDEPYQQERYPA